MTDLRKAAATALLALGLGLAVTPPAHAAGDAAPAPVGAAELAQAREAAQSPAVLDQLGRFFAREGAGRSGPPALGAAPAGPGAARLAGDTVAVYTLDEGFVAGAAGAPVARADFVASRAVSADGRVASVWTVQEGGRWRVVNIASGGDEGDYAAKAASGGGTAFREPQLNAWYVLREGRVLPLDDEARRSVGAGGVTLAAYQRLVHQRYGDKLPGSAYDRAGRGGGYRADDAVPAGHGVALPVLTAAAALGVTALAGAGAALRRRPRSGARARVRG